MSERKSSNIKFINLHSHDGTSVFDGLGLPSEHFNFAYENGMDAMAITNHGHMNSLPYMLLHQKKMREEGKKFKCIYGCEAYFHPNIEEWKKQKEEIDRDKKAKKSKKDDEVSGTVVENEEETKKQIKNILNKRRHLVLLAQNEVGLKNLFKLISKSYTGDNYYRFPRIDYKMLEEHNEGIIVSTACMGGILAGDMWEHYEDGDEQILAAMRKTVRRMKDIFGDRFYGEIQWNAIPDQHKLNKFVMQVCKEEDVEVISTADSHYPNKEAWLSRSIYKKLGWLSSKKDEVIQLPQNIEELGYELYPKNGDEMWEAYKRYSKECNVEYDDSIVLASIERTHDIAFNKIADYEPDTSVKLPSFVVPEGKTADEALKEIAEEGLRACFRRKYKRDNKFHRVTKEYTQRLEYELGVIAKLEFSKYFLTMKAIVDEVSTKHLSGPARGSGGGSLVAYACGITQIDPIENNLQFERFLRSDAKDMPDIDWDVTEPMKAKQLLIDKWGANNVVPISNWNTFQLRSLIKDISKFYDIPFTEVNAVTGKMLKEATPLAKKKHGITAGVYVPTFEEVKEFSTTLQAFLRKYPDVATHIDVLHGSIRSCSRHAGGAIISENVNENMPLINSGGVLQSPWSEGQNVRHLEPMGFIKFDILGLSTLEMMENAIHHILKRHHNIEKPTIDDIKQYYDENLHPDVITEEPEVFKNIFQKGKFVGIFQFTNEAAQNFCKQAKPKSILDISAITSIYRPGAMSANVHKQYVKVKKHPEKIEYVHPYVKEITENTFGFIVFQEQIASLAYKMGKDISLEEGNLFRKVLTKKGTGKADKVLADIHPRFIEGCVEKGLTKTQAEELYKKCEYFAGYGFNKCLSFSEKITTYNKNGEKIEDKRIKDIKPGCYVRSRDEKTRDDIFVKVKKKYNNGKKKVFKFILDDGREIKCTKSHKFRTKCGKMLPIQEILEKNLEIL